MTGPAPSSKRDARARSQSRLLGLQPAKRTAFSRGVAERLWTLPEMRDARTLLLYASTPEEVDTDAVAREAARRGIRTLYPRCGADSNLLYPCTVGSPKDLVPGRFGLREPPVESRPFPVTQIDIALIPGLAWDRSGSRLGRGGGFYDRLLATPDWRAVRCGFFFSVQEVSRVPTDSWDVSLDMVVTEREVLHFRN